MDEPAAHWVQNLVPSCKTFQNNMREKKSRKDNYRVNKNTPKTWSQCIWAENWLVHWSSEYPLVLNPSSTHSTKIQISNPFLTFSEDADLKNMWHWRVHQCIIQNKCCCMLNICWTPFYLNSSFFLYYKKRGGEGKWPNCSLPKTSFRWVLKLTETKWYSLKQIQDYR